MAYAHTPNAEGDWHDLGDHLRDTAHLAEGFAAEFGAGEFAHYAALWHDLGKFHPDFQQRLRDLAAERPAQRVDHKAAGSVVALEHFGPLAFLIQGHHGGLDSRTGFEAWLAERTRGPAVDEALALARAALPELTSPPSLRQPDFGRDRAAGELFLRMLFSTLVDADFLDTERHFNRERFSRRGADIDLRTLLERLEADRATFVAGRTAATEYERAVASAREAIYEDCVRAASQPPGLFRLTVPTGGGKTRSGMAFALHHAVQHGLRRVVVAVPFLTITEQTAGVYRGILGDPSDDPSVVLEHHSGVNWDGDDEDDEEVWRRLAAENWDAAITVTTTVQLFESLFSNRPGRTRKLHRLAKSVIVLDEAQALPSHLLTPTLDALRELVTRYGATLVLSTATQPAFEAITPFASVRAAEIVQDPGRWFELLRRVRYEFLDTPLSWAEVGARMSGERQALAVVNTKKDAFALLEALGGDEAALHLSTNLCGAHRRVVIEEVRRRLAADEPCHLVSTQVVEAGVDLDFPLVLRAAGPLDSVIQAAGRCNREGRMGREGGRVLVFRPAEGGLPRGAYRTATDVTRSTLASLDPDEDEPDRPEVLSRYFRQFFGAVDTDRERVQEKRAAFDFPEVARAYRMIEPNESVAITTYGSDEEQRQVAGWLAELRAGARAGRRSPRWLLRRLQPYLVSLPTHEAERLRQRGRIAEIIPGLGEWQGRYDRVRGIDAEGIDLGSYVV